MTPAEVLTRAAVLIEERGWTQYQYQDADGCMCASGAIWVAAGGSITGSWASCVRDGNKWNEATQAETVLRRHLRLRTRNVPDWNDVSKRTKDDVVAALRAAGRVS